MNDGLVLKNVHRIIKFNQNACLKPYINRNTDIGNKQKMILKKTFLSWWIMQFLGKLSKRYENMEILNLPQQKEEGIIWYQN